jgi:hypothetical protein
VAVLRFLFAGAGVLAFLVVDPVADGEGVDLPEAAAWGACLVVG